MGIRDSSLRRTLEAAADPHLPSDTTLGHSHSPDSGTHSDRAILGLCDLLGLVFALPFGEDLYHGTPITGWHVAYLVLGLMLAGIGHMWPRIKASLPSRLAQTAVLASLDFRIWIGVLLVAFLITV